MDSAQLCDLNILCLLCHYLMIHLACNICGCQPVQVIAICLLCWPGRNSHGRTSSCLGFLSQLQFHLSNTLIYQSPCDGSARDCRLSQQLYLHRVDKQVAGLGWRHWNSCEIRCLTVTSSDYPFQHCASSRLLNLTIMCPKSDHPRSLHPIVTHERELCAPRFVSMLK